MANVYARNIAKWLARADIMRIDTSAPNSPFARVRLLVDTAGNVAVMRPDVINTMKMLLVWVEIDSIYPTDSPVFRVDSLHYGRNVEIDNNVLGGIKRYFEATDSVYVAVTAETLDAPITTVATLRYDRGERSYFHTTQPLLGINDPECWIGNFVARARANKESVDQRKEEWIDGEKTLATAYGMYRLQQKAERADRAANKVA